MIPAIMLVREGSTRLPRKWALPWNGVPLAVHAVQQAEACPVVHGVHVVTDSEEIGRKIEANTGARVYLHPGMGSSHTSLQGLRWAGERTGLMASYTLLIQCTAPFINPTDLERLVLLGLEHPGREVWGLTTDMRNPRPSGMAWLVPPFVSDLRPTRWVLQDAPGFDIDTQEDYDRAVAHSR